MKLNTASEVISLIKQLEEKNARFYESLAQRFEKDKETLLSLGKEHRKNISQVESAYYSVATDAIEGSFTFDIDPDEYAPKADLPSSATYAEAIGHAVQTEDRMARLYSRAAEQSKSLLADVSRTLALIARKTASRRDQLRALLQMEK